MGTRSTIKVYGGWDGKEEIIASIYSQWDGYIQKPGMGYKLFSMFRGVRIVNGYSMEMASPSHFNGMGCLAAWLIGHLKEGQIGNIYMTSPTDQQEYNYEIRESKDGEGVVIRCLDSDDKELFNISSEISEEQFEAMVKALYPEDDEED